MNEKAKKNWRRLRAALIKRGINPRSWANQKGYPVSTVYAAGKGLRSGVETTRIRTELEEAAYA